MAFYSDTKEATFIKAGTQTINKTPIEDGQIIFNKDNKTISVDGGGVREEYGVSNELKQQIDANKNDILLCVKKDQGIENNGKILGINELGKVVPIEKSSGGDISLEDKAQIKNNTVDINDMVLKVTNLIKNGDFKSKDNWTNRGGTFTVANNTAILATNSTDRQYMMQQVIGEEGQAIEQTGKIYYFQMNLDAKFGVGGSAQQNQAFAVIRYNTSAGLKFIMKELIKEEAPHIYHTNYKFESTNLNNRNPVQFMAEYINANFVPQGQNVKFKNVICVCLTDIFGEGREPSSEEFYNLLNGFENRWFDGTKNIFNKDTNFKRFSDIEKKTVKYDMVVTVGENGDFQSLNSALEYLSTFYPTYKNGGLKIEAKILSGTIIKEQIAVIQNDMQYITITSEDPYVLVDARAFETGGLDAHDLRGDVHFIGGENASKLPTIGTVFKLGVKNEKPVVGYFANRGSEGVVLANCGFDGFYDGVIANNESSITIREGISKNMERWGVHARHNGEVSARSCDCTNCGIGAYADRVADLDVREANVSSSKIAIIGDNTSRINANGCHANNCGDLAEKFVVKSGNGSIVNCSHLEIRNAKQNVFWVDEGGILVAIASDTFGTEKTIYNTKVNEVSRVGIIFS